MIGNLLVWEANNVAGQLTIIAKICGVGFLSPRIPFAREDSFPADRFKSLSDSTDTSEEIDKGERGIRARVVTDSPQNLPQCRFNIERQGDLAIFPARNGLSIHVQLLCKHALGEVFAGLH